MPDAVRRFVDFRLYRPRPNRDRHVRHSEWVSPPTRPELISSLVSGAATIHRNIEDYLRYLYHQIRSREYDRLANLAVLKLYQFNPDLYNPDVVVNILVKALASVPFPDFNLSVALLGDRASNPNMDESDPLDLLPNLTNLQSLAAINLGFPHFGRMYRSDALETLYDNYMWRSLGLRP